MRPFDDVDLHAYVDNQVGASRREAITSYLKQAPAEAERVARWQGQCHAIQSAFAAVTAEPVPLWLTVGQIAEHRSKPARSSKPPARQAVGPSTAKGADARRPSRQTVPPLLACALAFALGVSVPYAMARWPVLGGNPLLTMEASPRQGFERRAIEAHGTFATDPDHPIEVADTPPGTLKTWLERRVPFSVTIPNLRAQGWTLRGGRLAPAEQGPGALLVFDNAIGDRLSLFTARVPDVAKGEVSEAEGIVSWIDGSVGYALLTSRSPSWLKRNANQLSAAVKSVPEAE